jgi:hypothetical protein
MADSHRTVQALHGKYSMIKIFLDQNHWIALAKAYYGKAEQSSHIDILNRLYSEINSGEIILPLQISHLVEFNRNNNKDRRKRMAVVFERYSKGWFFAPWSAILPYEFSIAIAKTFGVQITSPNPQIFGKGVLFSVSEKQKKALIDSGRLKFGINFYENLSTFPGALLDLLTFPNEKNRKEMIEGDRKRRDKYVRNSESSRDFDDSIELERRAMAAMYTYNHQTEIKNKLFDAGLTFDKLIALGPQQMSDFFDNVPSFDVDRSLTIYRDRQKNRPIQGNDMNDIGYLAMALPYCDKIVVEKFWGHAIRTQKLDEKYNTEVLTNLSEL